jgi:hypothetical protein
MNGAPVDAMGACRAVLETGRLIKTGEGMAELLRSAGTFVRLAVPRGVLYRLRERAKVVLVDNTQQDSCSCSHGGCACGDGPDARGDFGPHAIVPVAHAGDFLLRCDCIPDSERRHQGRHDQVARSNRHCVTHDPARRMSLKRCSSPRADEEQDGGDSDASRKAAESRIAKHGAGTW